ncbi:MAG: ATP-binding protein [Saprospiraceae bacterium]|nr:ATP-binding protein [Saprospiraceae bacterium]
MTFIFKSILAKIFNQAIAHDFVQKALFKKGSFIVYYRSSSQPNYELLLPAPLSTFVKAEEYIRDNDFFDEIYLAFLQPKIYSINISKLKEPYPLRPQDNSIDSDGSNLVSFIDTMKDKHDEIMSSINKGLRDCIKEFKSISLDNVELEKDHVLKKLHGERTFKKLGVKDKTIKSIGPTNSPTTPLYFLALLAIIHQPDPPKLLMIEEPENGIHPRRIKEIIDYFFTIAQDKGIQVILTTHSTVVIDQFKDIPESIFVFDKKDQTTQVKNLATDIIAEDIELSKKNNVPPLDLSGSLGDHWAAGLIGGVPR